MVVLGSIPELGNWKEFKAHMKWTDGHIWETKEPILTTAESFRYKYALVDGDEDEVQTFLHMEKGIDRIINVNHLTPQQGSSAKITHLHLNDEHEKFKVHFSVFYPLTSHSDTLMVQLAGDSKTIPL